MEKLNLKNVLTMEIVKRGIKENLFKSENEVNEAIDKTISNKKDNSISIKTNSDNKEVTFENTLWIDVEKNCYLLESRIFDDNKNGEMINAYLEIIQDGLIVNNYIDDVWEYANWKTV